MKGCGIEGCTRAEYRRSLCRAHYEVLPRELKPGRASAPQYHAEFVRSAQAFFDGTAQATRETVA